MISGFVDGKYVDVQLHFSEPLIRIEYIPVLEKLTTHIFPPNLTRRDFLTSVGGIASLVALGSIARFVSGDELLRPPGAPDEKSFLACCIRCDRCRSICPTSVIGIGEGFTAARTPVMNFRIGYCDFCGKCVEVCPTQALRPFDKKTVRIGLAEITDRCIAWNSGGCTICVEQCPWQAIVFDGRRRPVIDAAKCNGCGVCENVCPALILRSYLGGTARGIIVHPGRTA